MDKAKELLKMKDQGTLRGKSTILKHSFASLCNNTLIDTAKSVHVSLGKSGSDINMNVNQMKQLESSRMETLAANQSEIFLPSDIDITMEDILEETDINEIDDTSSLGSCADDDEHNLVELSYRIKKDGR